MFRKTVLIIFVCGAVAACSSKGNDNSNAADSGGGDDGGRTNDGGGDGGTGPTTTIAKVRQGNPTGSFTVQAVVTAVRGDDPTDTKEWYIEDPAGGAYSGIAVFCDKTKGCPAAVAVPSRLDLVLVTGTLTPYKGKLEITPTAQTTISQNAQLPPLGKEDPADLGASGNSSWRGVLIQVQAAKLTVDDVTPQALDVAKCDPPAADGGVTDAGSEAGAGDGGGATISTCGCKPPRWAGFEVNDGSGNKLLVENHFFTSEHLANSPECLSGAGAIPVSNGMTFSAMQGIFDFNPGNSVQTLAPVVDSDYKTP